MGHRAWPVQHRILAPSCNQSPGPHWFHCRVYLPSRRRRALKEDMDGPNKWVHHLKSWRNRCSPHITRMRNPEVCGQIAVPSNKQWSWVWSTFNKVESCKSTRSQDPHHPSRLSAHSWLNKRRLWSKGRKNAQVPEDRPRTLAVFR